MSVFQWLPYLAYTQLDRRERYLMEEVEADRKLSLEKLLKGGVLLEKLRQKF